MWFLDAYQSFPPALHSKTKGFFMDEMKVVVYIYRHFVPSHFISKLHLSGAHTPPISIYCRRAPWEVVSFPDISKKRNHIPSTGRTFFFFYIWAPLLTSPLLLFFFSYWFTLLTGGKCHSYQWKTGGWSNNERVVWCQRSDGVNVTGESCHVITWERLQQH